MKVLLIDNYDSFTYNLYQYIGEVCIERCTPFDLHVFRNTAITASTITATGYDAIVISPGPGTPDDPAYFGVCAEVITTISQSVPVLGVCLGMQGIVHYLGGRVVRAEMPMHGKTSTIRHNGLGVFKNLPQDLEVMRYHSLIADKTTLPDCLTITAEVHDTGEIMGVRHTTYPLEGIQFHPESFATEGGKQLLANFLFRG